MVPEAARERLGAIVRKRRLELSLSVRGAADVADINRATWDGVETGERAIQPHNQTKMERTLGWEMGSIANILAGGEPTEAASPRTVDFVVASPTIRNMLVDLRYIDGLDEPATIKAELMHLLVHTHMQAEDERRKAEA